MKVTIQAQGTKTTYENFWNHIHFHPTDAIEDDWGKGILSRIAEDKIAKYVRLYTMFEDIVSRGADGKLQFDFSLNDHRLDYLLSLGLKPLICYNFMAPAIAKDPLQVSKMERYKKKRMNFSEPADYREWEEVCYQYAKHVTERYGENEVKTWYMHCWNEPDFHYWLKDLTYKEYPEKLPAYLKLYDHFAEGVKRANPDLRIGGPSACYDREFVDGFLRHTKEGTNHANGGTGAKIDFFSIHVYPSWPEALEQGMRPSSMRMITNIYQEYNDIAKRYGYENMELIADEWGASAGGNRGTENYPTMAFRDNEYFPAFYVRMVDLMMQEFPKRRIPLSKMLICLSGQHHLDRDFEGFRNFFTLNEYTKPIYNGYKLMAKLGLERLELQTDRQVEGVGVIPTEDDGRYAISLYYTHDDFYKKLENQRIVVRLEGLTGRYAVRHYRIDRMHSNSYTKYLELGSPNPPTQMQREDIREAGKLELLYPEYEMEINGAYEEAVVMSAHSVSLIELVPVRN